MFNLSEVPIRRSTAFFSMLAVAGGLLAVSSVAVAQKAEAPEFSSSAEQLSAAVEVVNGSSSLDGVAGSGVGSGAGAGQPERPYGRRNNGVMSHLTYEVGGGFNAPSKATSNAVSWGGNVTAGAGYRISPYLSLMTEFQFIDDKLPGRLISETGANGGNAHIWSLTLAPVIDLFPRSRNDLYVTGGGGFYRKVTNFTDPVAVEYCDYFYCGIATENQVVGHFSSNQGGWNAGLGATHSLGSAFGGETKAKLFAEVRYLYIDTPAVDSSPNGLGRTTVRAGTSLVPVTLGVRF